MVLADFSRLVECYCELVSNSGLMKLRMADETILNLIFAYNLLPLSKCNTAIRGIVF